MKHSILLLLAAFFSFSAGAQVRSYNDNASGTFVIGLDSYFYGASGALSFEAAGKTFQASVSPSEVSVNGQRLCGGGDVVIGIHDFSGNSLPDLVVAARENGGLSIAVYALQGNVWRVIGTMKVSQDASEARVFRQVISIRRGEVLCSWTYRDGKFVFKASDGRPESQL